MNSPATNVTIRSARPEDELAITRLAALDSAAVPPPPFVLAEVDGELRAAVSLANGRAIADPFHPTVHVVAMLRAYSTDTAPADRRDRRRGVYRSGRLALEY